MEATVKEGGGELWHVARGSDIEVKSALREDRHLPFSFRVIVVFFAPQCSAGTGVRGGAEGGSTAFASLRFAKMRSPGGKILLHLRHALIRQGTFARGSFAKILAKADWRIQGLA